VPPGKNPQPVRIPARYLIVFRLKSFRLLIKRLASPSAFTDKNVSTGNQNGRVELTFG